MSTNEPAPKIVAFAGSLREGSFNKKLARLGAAALRAAGAEVTLVDLRDLPMPLYDGDLEAKDGIPPEARRWKEILLTHEGFFIAAPEYNSSITGVLKNAIDWASRAAPGEATLACFTAKSAALVSASPGSLGGIRGLAALRSILENIGTLVVPDMLSVPRAHEAFDAEGRLKDAKQAAALERIAARLCRTILRLRG
jgi:NAD(P)H-dependent FMN reductase